MVLSGVVLSGGDIRLGVNPGWIAVMMIVTWMSVEADDMTLRLRCSYGLPTVRRRAAVMEAVRVAKGVGRPTWPFPQVRMATSAATAYMHRVTRTDRKSVV